MKKLDGTLQSMTGYGQASGVAGSYRVRIDIKSVNHRYAEVSSKLPREWMVLEDVIRKTVLDKIKRGKVDVFVTIDRDLEASKSRQIVIDWPLVQQVVDAAEQLQEKQGIEGTLTVRDLLNMPELVRYEDQDDAVDESIKQSFQSILEEAVNQLLKMRMKEGSHLHQDIRARLAKLEQRLEAVEAKSGPVVKILRDRLRERIRELLENTYELDEQRVMTEAAILADKADIAEEITRLKSHLLQFGQLLISTEPVGRKLDFLVQEIHRELNTIGSKTVKTDIVGDVIEMKSELERVREQVQNIQ